MNKNLYMNKSYLLGGSRKKANFMKIYINAIFDDIFSFSFALI
jgi:hypothetical protein